VGLVTLFSDPMVDVLSAVGTRTGIPVFYISFVLSPLVSNASELISSIQFAGERARTPTRGEGGGAMATCWQAPCPHTVPPGRAGKKTAKSITLTYSQLLGEARRAGGRGRGLLAPGECCLPPASRCHPGPTLQVPPA
jgi:hypothetical protein